MIQTNPTKTTSITPNHCRAALNWFDSMRNEDQWNLTIAEQIELLGGIKERTYKSWKKKAVSDNEPIELGRDVMERLSLLIGIYKALQIIAPSDKQGVGNQWFNTVNLHPLFMGKSPKEYLLTMSTMNALYAVRRYLDAARG